MIRWDPIENCYYSEAQPGPVDGTVYCPRCGLVVDEDEIAECICRQVLCHECIEEHEHD